MLACRIFREERLPRKGVLASLISFSIGLMAASALRADVPLIALTPEEQAWVRQHPQIIVGLDPAWPPYSYYSSDHVLVGIDVDMLAALRSHTGINFVAQSGVTWSDVYARAQKHKVDMLGGMAETPEREAIFDFTEPYVQFPVGIITRNDAPFMLSVEELQGQKVSAARDYATTLFLKREYPNIHLIETQNVGDALELVSGHEAFATLDNLASANYTIKDHGLTNLKVAGILSDQFALRYGVRKDWPMLSEILRKALASISDRERETIKDKWIDLDVDDVLASRHYMHILLVCLGLVGAAILIMLAWNRTLMREVARRKLAELELSEARDRAVDSNRMKSAFLANLSHEIRNPLNAVLGFSELLKEDATDPHLKRYVDGIDAGGRTLLGIINDVLDLAKIEAGRIEIHRAPVDVRLILQETQALFAPRAQQKGLEFTQSVSPRLPKLVLLDELRVRQVLYNAVTNAIKFTTRGAVTLSADWVGQEKAPVQNDLILAVTDTGAGIPAEDHHRIFEPFAQREGQSPLLGGTGLGLAISKRLTEAMGGHLELESAPEKGSAFRFVFPNVQAVNEQASAPVGKAADLSDFHPIKVLVVDDLESNRELLKEYFQRAGHAVMDAADAEQGITCAQMQRPDVVLLDFRLPGMNGREAARQLKADPRTAQIPVILLSGSMEIAREAAADPTAPMLAKPLVYADLCAMLRRLLPHAVKAQPTAVTAPGGAPSPSESHRR